MSTKHTPGPWSPDSDEDGDYISPEADLSVGVCEIMPIDRGGEKDFFHGAVTRANARLIAASPTMYAYIESRAKAGDQEAASILERIHA